MNTRVCFSDQLSNLIDDWSLIPLHRHDDKSTRHGRTRKDGKRPLHNNWTTRKYSSREVLKQCRRENRNIGVRLKPHQLVIDVDPRNGGTEGFTVLCLDLGIDPDQFPAVETGSGGDHYYMSKPVDLLIVDSLKKYPGVEFKSKGRQVVAAGSVHPETGRHYEWVRTPSASGLPPAPQALLDLIARPERHFAATGGGQFTHEEIAHALEGLDPTDFREHSKWLNLMMAVHHASNGDARHEWVEWSTSDPEYSGHADLIGRRWDSLRAAKSGAVVTYRTLNKILAEHGAADRQIIDYEAVADDFVDVGSDDEDDSWMEGGFDDDVPPENPGGYSDDDISALAELNEKHCAITAGGKYRIVTRSRNPRAGWEMMAKTDFLSLYENRRTVNPNNPDKVVSLGTAWQTWGQRRTAYGTVFDTSLPAGAINAKGNFNLWLGWTIEPKAGKWDRLNAMLFHDLCADNVEHFEYLLNWIAWKIQNPAALPQVAIAFRGSKGVGKGTLGELLVYLFGPHALATSQMEHIAGRFNGHMEFVLFTFADEALWAGDPRQEAAIKKLITDDSIMYEHKGVGAYPGVNRNALMFATNDDWVVPAGENERRYFVLRASDAHRCPEGEPDHPNRAYWNALYSELESGGRAAFLHAMISRKLPAGWHPRAHVPVTSELANQKARGFKRLTAFIFERLQDGAIEETCDGTNEDWGQGVLYVDPNRFVESYRAFVHVTEPRMVVSRRQVIEELERKHGWQVGDHTRVGKARKRAWLCPPLHKARDHFNRLMRGDFFDE